MPPAVRFDPLASSPYPSYGELRRDAPAYRVPGAGYFVVSRLEDVRAVARQPDVFSSQLFMPGIDGPAAPRPLTQPRGVIASMARDFALGGRERPCVLTSADPPLHTRQRRIVSQAFGARRGMELEASVRRIADGLLDEIGTDRHVEWMRRYALRLPLMVIADVLGLPPDDVPHLKRWTEHAVASVSAANTPAAIRGHARAWAELESHLAARLAGATDRNDVLGALARAIGDGPDALLLQEAVTACTQLLVGGNESTSSLLGSAVLLLVQHPAVEARLRAEPSAIAAFVEEAMRLESPFQGHFRVATRDAEVGGVRIPAGARVLLLWGSANRDERGFDAPDVLDLDRANPKDHVAFGEGIHYCLGAGLARLEVRITIERLLARYTGLRLAPGHRVAYLRSLYLRRPAALELQLGRRAG